MTTLADITLMTAKLIANVVEGEADSGSMTTLVDASRDEGDDYFARGTIWFLDGDNDGVSALISAWDDAATEFTFGALSNTVSAGDRYAATGKFYPRQQMIQAVNKALNEMGLIVTEDMSLACDGSQRYTLPSGVNKLLQVHVDNGEDDEDFIPHYQWRVVGNELVFDTDEEPSSNYGNILLIYKAPHDELTADSDTVNRYIDDLHLAWSAAVELLRWRDQRRDGQDDQLKQQLNEAMVMKERYAGRSRFPTVQRTPHLAGW
jgi:hypothetical protein